MHRCAFLSLEQRGDFVIDDEHAIAPLASLGWEVSTLPWRQRARRWGDFDAVIIRSTWDYWDHVPEFLDTLVEIDRETRLANPLRLVRWNLAKTYLRDLESRGVDVVPTLWMDGLDNRSAAECADRIGADELVVKPVVGANGQDAFRFSRAEEPTRWARIAARFAGRGCMVQPFLPAVISEGEYSLFFFNGDYSHAILKVPAAGEFRSQEERGAAIHRIDPETGLLLAARRAIAAVSPVPLYGRIDLLRNAVGGFDVMELELIEPSLYLRMDAAAPERFATAIDRWFQAACTAEGLHSPLDPKSGPA
jgi:glutathione synthase/RimK-type ligase-like ATP-grasp enzyme